MKAVVGVFKSRSDAEVGAADLAPLQIPRDRLQRYWLLTPAIKRLLLFPPLPANDWEWAKR